jgi:nucleoside-diphosphate-sugar epimerase
MRTFVTGASGFIGTALCAALRAAGHEPVRVSLRGAAPRFDGAQAVVHLAGIAHRGRIDPQVLERINVSLAEEVGHAAATAGAPLLFLSSAKVHGEESAAPLDERAALAPRDIYAQTKARAEERLRAVAGLRLTVLRPPLVYGPGVKANFLALLRAVDRGLPLPFAAVANRRSLLYVGNLADAILRCLAAPQAAGRSYLVADAAPLSTPELCRGMARALGRPARLFALPAALLELLPGARRLTRSLEVDDGALRRELGWRPPFDFVQGMAATVHWYRGP